MQTVDIDRLMTSLNLQHADLIQTHISWVLLCNDVVYKIKKPVRFSFLDFSTLELRHKYCRRELELNRRLTEGIYLDVVPIRKSGDLVVIDGDNGEVIDYAVKMKRLPQERQMDIMLGLELVTEEQLTQVARMLAAFHARAKISETPPDPDAMLADFEDLENYNDFIRARFGEDGVWHIRQAARYCHSFLHKHSARIAERYRLGFVVDGHGDLHSKNIFLLDQPVIFDCIEFNDHLRQVDVLDELAFFCLDLEYFGQHALAVKFVEEYTSHNPCILTSEDELLFYYYQLYRAGVKLKINLIKAGSSTEEADQRERLKKVDGYYGLFRTIMLKLIGMEPLF